MESKVIAGSRIKISRPRHRKRQNYYSINPYTRDLARTSCGLSRRSPRKLQQREKRGPAALFRELFFSFLARPPGTEPTLPETWWRFSSHVCAHLSIFHVHYISPISPLLFSFFSTFLRLPLSLLSLLFPARPGTESHKSRGGGGLQIIWNFPFDAEESPRGSFSTRDSQTNDRFRRYFWPRRLLAPDITLTPFAFPQSAFLNEFFLHDFDSPRPMLQSLVFLNFENSFFFFSFLGTFVSHDS